MPYTLNITEKQIMTAVRGFLTTILPANVEVVRGQVNDVPESKRANFVVMTPMLRRRLSTNVDTFDILDPDPAVISSQRGTLIGVQLDIHGPNGADNGQVISTLWRDDFACRTIDNAIFSPLYANDGHQMPFINGEKRYEDRWVMEIFLQAKPIVSTPMEFADALEATLVIVDLP